MSDYDASAVISGGVHFEFRYYAVKGIKTVRIWKSILRRV